MPAIFDAARFTPMLGNVFNGAGTYYPIYQAQLFGGTMPANPTITAGITARTGVKTLAYDATWNAAAGGVVALAAPIAFTATSTGDVSFIRFINGSAQAILDVPVGLTSTGSQAVITSLTATNGAGISITDLRFRVATSGNACFSDSIANELVNMLAGNTAQTLAAPLSAMSKLDGAAATYTRTITIDAYDGAIPANAIDAPTGTKLWTKSMTGNDLFAATAMSLGLVSSQAANAIASGTPTFLRATKAAYTGGAFSFPACVMQVPISATNGALFSSPTMSTGVSNTLTNLAIAFEP